MARDATCATALPRRIPVAAIVAATLAALGSPSLERPQAPLIQARVGGGQVQQRFGPSAGANTEAAYDGRFVFVRLRWRPAVGGRRSFWSTAWDHDYPRAERHLSQILGELTTLDVNAGASRVLTLDDPALFHFPIAFMWEPGFWTMTDAEAAGLRAYLLKGGFAVFEDFDGATQWANFEAQIRRALPEARFVRLDGTHPIFRTFFEIHDVDAIVHPMNGMRPSYFGVFEDNDPAKRLLLVANFDNDVPEYWEWSGEGLFPFDTSNEAYKLGVNYMIYGHTR